MADNQPITTTSDENSIERTRAIKRESAKRAYEADPEKFRAKARAYHANNREKRREQNKRYNTANAQKISEQKAAHRQANLEQERMRNRDYMRANRDAINAKKRAHYAANAEEMRQAAIQWRKDNHETAKANWKAYYDANREKLIAKSSARYRQKAYNLSPEQFAAMIESQGGRCAVCKVPFSEAREFIPCVDHSHSSGKIRGILCRLCNTTIGHAHDNPKILRACAQYLESFKEV